MDKEAADMVHAELKKILRDYRRMDASTRRKLKAIGIMVVETRKHYKLYYKDDFHHCFSLSKTPSGSRTGANSVSRIYNNLILAQAA